MKRKNRKSKIRKNGKQAGTAAIQPNSEPVGRRAFLDFVRSWGVVTVAVAGGGWYLVDDFVSTFQELDLSKIGNGIPAVVQIHDPECPRCRELQREARDAMGSFGGGELQYLVANIRQDAGRDMAAKYGVGNVTLLLFDADGKRQDTLVGITPSERLVSSFRLHVARHSRRKTVGAK